MRYAEILSSSATLRRAARAHAAHCPLEQAGLSRRQFLQGAAGVTAFTATLGSSFAGASDGRDRPRIGLVLPIPGTLTLFGEEFHVLAPPLTAADDDPSSVYNFAGTTGIAFISGSVERTDRKTGESRTMPYSFNDMRFMQGRFKGRDGRVRKATFAFTWIDVYDPSLGDPAPQVHDFNPGIESSGLFWTSIVEHDEVSVATDKRRATLEVRNLEMKDFFDLENAVVGGGARPVRAAVSYKVEWNTIGAPNAFDNAAQKFRGEFGEAAARMEWSARTKDFTFRSAPLATSTTDAAQLGTERNGSFY